MHFVFLIRAEFGLFVLTNIKPFSLFFQQRQQSVGFDLLATFTTKYLSSHVTKTDFYTTCTKQVKRCSSRGRQKSTLYSIYCLPTHAVCELNDIVTSVKVSNKPPPHPAKIEALFILTPFTVNHCNVVLFQLNAWQMFCLYLHRNL